MGLFSNEIMPIYLQFKKHEIISCNAIDWLREIVAIIYDTALFVCVFSNLNVCRYRDSKKIYSNHVVQDFEFFEKHYISLLVKKILMIRFNNILFFLKKNLKYFFMYFNTFKYF